MSLVQELIDGRLSPDEAQRVEALIRTDPDLAHAAAFYRWLNDELPRIFNDDKQQLPDRLRRLVDDLAADDEKARAPVAAHGGVDGTDAPPPRSTAGAKDK